MRSSLVAVLSMLSLAAFCEEGFKPLFNGRDLGGWEGHTNFWSVKDGAITAETATNNLAKYNTFLIWRGGAVSNFELRLEFRIAGKNGNKGVNSGVQFRSAVLDGAKYIVGGYQADVDPAQGNWGIGSFYEERGRGFLAKGGERTVVREKDGKTDVAVTGSFDRQEELKAAVARGEWMDYRIIAEGNHIRLFMNGIQTIDTVDEQASKAPAAGILALQLHAGPPMQVQFRNIRIRSLDGN